MLIIIDVLTYCVGGSTQTLTFEPDPDVPSWDRFFLLLLLLSNFAYKCTKSSSSMTLHVPRTSTVQSAVGAHTLPRPYSIATSATCR